MYANRVVFPLISKTQQSELAGNVIAREFLRGYIWRAPCPESQTSCTTPRVVTEKNIVMSPAGPGTHHDSADEGQQQFIRPDPGPR
jgi:hypothetical protein